MAGASFSHSSAPATDAQCGRRAVWWGVPGVCGGVYGGMYTCLHRSDTAFAEANGQTRPFTAHRVLPRACFGRHTGDVELVEVKQEIRHRGNKRCGVLSYIYRTGVSFYRCKRPDSITPRSLNNIKTYISRLNNCAVHKTVRGVKHKTVSERCRYPCYSGLSELPRETVALYPLRKLHKRLFLSWYRHC